MGWGRVAMTVHSDHADLDTAGLAGALTVGVCAQYLEDMADCVTREAQWRVSHLNAGGEALMVVEGDFTGVVMPLKIKAPEPAAVVVEQEPEPEPCPAAVAAMATQLVGKVQESAKTAPVKVRKPRLAVAA